MKKVLTALSLATGAIILAAQSVIAQQSITAAGYTQNFNSIGSGLPANWTLNTNATSTSLGTSSGLTNSNTTTWADTAGRFKNLSSANIASNSTTTAQNNNTDRALGIRQSGTLGDPGASFNFNFSTINVDLTSLSIDLMQLTDGSAANNRETTWTLQYGLGAAPTSFTTLDTFVAGGEASVWRSQTVTFDLNTNPVDFAAMSEQSSVWFRVVALTASDGGGSRMTFAIDNFNLTAANAGPVIFSSSASNAWLSTNNWTGGSVPGSSDVAQFGANPTGTTVGINMGSVAGAQSVGAIDVTSDRTTALAITNSSGGTAGVLTLEGVDVGVRENVILRSSSSQTLTLANGSSRTMGVALGNATENVVVIDGSGDINISSIISGAGRNLTLTGSGTGILTLSGANTYSGVTSIESGTLALGAGGSIADSARILVSSGATFDVSALESFTVGGAQAIGGAGTIAGNLSLASGAGLIVFDLNTPLTVTGTVSLANNFSIASLRGADGGAFDWSSVDDGVYTIISNIGSSFDNIENFGELNKVPIGGDRFAYFSEGSLQVNVVPEPSTYALLVLAGLGLAGYAARRRQRQK